MELNGMFSDAQVKYLDSIKTDKENQKLIKNQEMGQDAFLKLLMAEMQNQDPMDPMDNKETVAQMAQFSTVEQLNQISDSVEKSNAQAEQSVIQIENAIAKLNNNFVEGGNINGDKLDEINKNQKQLLDEMIKLNKAMNAYFTETASTNNII